MSYPQTLVALVLVTFLLSATVATTQSTTSLAFAPADLTLAATGAGTVDIQLSNAQDVTSYEIDLIFDPAVIDVERVERLIGTEVQPSPDRSWVSLPAGDPNITYIEHSPGHITFGAYSFGANNPPGLDGNVTLVRLHLRGVDSGVSSLTAERVLLTDSQAQASTATAAPGSVTVGLPAYRLFLPYIIHAEPSASP